MFRYVFRLLTVFLIVSATTAPASGAQGTTWETKVRSLAGDGSVLAVDHQGKVLFSHNPDKSMMPASTLKVLTAATALDALGPDYRFVTEFWQTSQGDLYVVGRGDPFLVSEELEYMSKMLKGKGLAQVRNLYLDHSFFKPGLVLHGTSRSLNPYDAYNSALSVNFNTIFAHIDQAGKITSAEDQTPLTPMAEEMARKSGGRGKVRFNLSDNPATCLLYAGELMRAFFERSGIRVMGDILPGVHPQKGGNLIYRHEARQALPELIQKLFKYSNNFMTNQIFLTMGAEIYGPPAEPEKSRHVVGRFLTRLGLPAFHVEEGSGLSRRTKVTARQMAVVLRHFEPNYHLMTHEGRAWFKTGTMSDVKSMIGYLISDGNKPVYFVIMLNGKGIGPRVRDRILDLLEANLL